MRKLSLHLDDLRVESFATHAAPSTLGTVHGRADGGSDKATCDSCAGPNCNPSRASCASGGDVCCA
jgi:hypothetical protein